MPNKNIELEILKVRAEKLAEKQFDISEGKHAADMLFFRLTDERYAIDLEHVKDVFQVEKVTPIPCTPDYVKGIINVRGQIFSLLNLKVLFNLPHSSTNKKHKALLLSTPEMQFAIAVDEILGVTHLFLDDIQPPPATLNGLKADYVQGVTTEMTIVLNAEKMLTDQRLVHYEEVRD